MPDEDNVNYDTVNRARKVALAAHAGQQYGDEPFFVHLRDVVMVLIRYGYDSPLTESVAWLHDYLEDTTGTVETLWALFPGSVVDAVVAVTDEPGETRKERKEKTYPKIAGNETAIIVKLADRIANVEKSLATSNFKKMEMYVKEHAAFSEALGKNVHARPSLWARLDGVVERAQVIVGLSSVLHITP